jgi:DNA-binding Lrp family transcriptional regulator
MAEIIKLDLKDRKILSLLDENARYSNSQIAKKVGLSKPAIEYRVRKLIENKVIFEFYSVIDFTKLGYSQYKVYFKFQNTSLSKEEEITKYLSKQKGVVWLAQVRGNWDLAVSIIAQSNFEFGRIISEFMNKYSKFILQKDVLLTEYSPIYSRRYLTENVHEKEFLYGKPTNIIELDEEDEKILREIAVNSRINIVDLADKIKLSRDIINYRLKKMTSSGLVNQYRCSLNLNKIGINHYKIILRTKNLDERNEEKLKDFVASSEKSTQFLKLIGSWDIEIEFEVENENELYEILNKLRKEFSEIIRDFDILRITETFKYNYFPL